MPTERAITEGSEGEAQTEHGATKSWHDMLEDHYNAVVEQAKEVRRLEGEEDRLKDELNSIKSELKKANAELRRLCLADPSGGPLFSQTNEGEGEDAWRSVDLTMLEEHDGSLPIKKLQQAGIETLGQLSDYQRKDADFKQIKGVGAKAREKIEAAQLAWFQANPSKWKPGEESTDGGGEPDDGDQAAPPEHETSQAAS